MESCYITQVALLLTVLRLFFMKWPIKDTYHKPLKVHFMQMCPFLPLLSLETPSDQIVIAVRIGWHQRYMGSELLQKHNPKGQEPRHLCHTIAPDTSSNHVEMYTIT